MTSVEKLARKFAALERTVNGLARTRQIVRSVVETEEGLLPVEDLLTGAADTALTVGEQGDDLAVLDEVGALDLDSYLTQLEQSETDSDSAHDGHMTAIEALRGGKEALGAADQAAQAAAVATETALGNARYQQVDGEPAPEPPEGGFRVGAELTHVDVAGHPYRVEVWNGTAWVPNRLLLDQALFLSPDGTVQIGNGTLVSPTIIGGEFYGNKFEGGLFTLPSVVSETIVATDTFESTVSPWEYAEAGYTPPTRSTAQAQTGSASMLLGRNGEQFGAFRPLPATSFPNGGYISVWARRSSDGRVAIGSDNSGVQTPLLIAANVWTEIRRELAPGASVTSMWILGALPDSGGSVYIDSVRVIKYNASAGKAAVDRDTAGRARVYSVDAGGNVSGLRDGRAYSEFKNGVIEYSSETSPVPGGGLGTIGVQHVLKQVTAARTAQLQVAMNSNGTASLVSSATDRTQSYIALYDSILLRGAEIILDGRTSLQGNTFALKSNLDAWNDAPDGVHAWVVSTGWEYIRAKGKWIVNSTNGEVDITSSLLAAYRGTMSYSVAGGTLFLNVNAVGTIGVGQTVVGNLSSELRPLGLMAGPARLSSDYAGSFLVNAAGAVVAATRTGVTHTTATGSVAYALP